MKRYPANQEVDSGIYFNPRRLVIDSLEERGILPGKDGDFYVRLPVLLVLPIGLVLSVAFLIFLPLTSFAMLVMALFEKIGHGLRALAHTMSTHRHAGEKA